MTRFFGLASRAHRSGHLNPEQVNRCRPVPRSGEIGEKQDLKTLAVLLLIERENDSTAGVAYRINAE